MKRNLILTICLLIFALSLTACGKSPQETPAEGQPAPDDAGTEAAEPAAITEPLPLTGGATQDEAEEIRINTKYAGSYTDELWISFTTGAEPSEYAFTIVNLTPDGSTLYGHLYDEEGNLLEPDEITYSRNQGNTVSPGSIVQGSDNGKAGTGKIGSLQPDTTYYLRIRSHAGTDFSLVIKDSSGAEILGKAEKEAVSDPSAFRAGSNQDEATRLVLNEQYYGEYEDGYHWICFTTGPKKGETYTVTLENVTPGSRSLYGHLFDEEGTLIEPLSINYDRNQGNNTSLGSIVQGNPNGRAATGTVDTLEPDTTYYVVLQGSSEFPADYLLTVGSPGAPVPDHSAGTTEADLMTPADRAEPGVCQSAAIRIPLGTKVFAEYTDEYQWLAFTTGPDQGAEYYITGINCTPDSSRLYGHLYEKDGTLLEPVRINYERAQGNGISPQSVLQGNDNGRAGTGSIDTLAPDTTYYICLQGGSAVSYSMLVTSPEDRAAVRSTSSNIEEALGAVSEADSLMTGTNQNVAPILKHNVWYHGTFEEGYAWIAFMTGEQEGEYSVSLKNLTADTHPLYGHLYDEYGTLLVPDSINYTRAQGNGISPGSIVQGNENGAEAVGTIASLAPHTMYYVMLQGETPLEYEIMIGSPEQPVEEAEEETVFETPFELNETQVRFVADEATFIDEAEARAALAPVAEVILAHPGHAILLAGTTATFGDQAVCVRLSNARADAVKDMLVNDFGVPADQLVTAGLGYKDDPFPRGRDVDAYGNFVRTEAAKNRRVIVLDAESDIAKEILGN